MLPSRDRWRGFAKRLRNFAAQVRKQLAQRGDGSAWVRVGRRPLAREPAFSGLERFLPARGEYPPRRDEHAAPAGVHVELLNGQINLRRHHNATSPMSTTTCTSNIITTRSNKQLR